MTVFIQYLVNGLSMGSVYAIIALGYTMVYGIAKMLNFAHGDVSWSVPMSRSAPRRISASRAGHL